MASRRSLHGGTPLWIGVAAFLVVFEGHGVGEQLALQGKEFQIPPGYQMVVAAAPPLVERPMEMDFDSRGRLYVTESSGSNEPVEKQREVRPHRVLQLTDVDQDGVYDRRTVFADSLMFPEGCLWHEGSLYVAAPPEIWKLTDANDDGVAEHREVWFDGKTLTGCANDLHGPYRGPDGLFYWCKGAFASQEYDLPGRPGWKTTASHVFRARPGVRGPEELEVVFTAGMDNPVGLEWTDCGGMIVSGTFLQHPEGGRRDGLIHAVRGGLWGKDHEVLRGHPTTGPLLPAMTHMGPAAPCGMVRMGADLLVCQFNMRRVSRHVLVPEGATFRTIDEDFVTCTDPDFHPTDVLVAPDRSILMVDTGGWYKICCPTSQVAKPQIPGAIYRLRPLPSAVAPPAPGAGSGVVRSKAVVGQKFGDLEEALRALESEDLHARRQAAEWLGRSRRSEAAKPLLSALKTAGDDPFLRHAFTFALLEIGDAVPLREALPDADPGMKASCLYVLEQLPEGHLKPEDIFPLLSSGEQTFRHALQFVLSRHEDWAPRFLPWIHAQLLDPEEGEIGLLGEVLLHFRKHPRVLDLPGQELARPQPAPVRSRLLESMRLLKPAVLPTSWTGPLLDILTQGDMDSRKSVPSILETLKPAELVPFLPALASVANEPGHPLDLRLEALSLLPRPRMNDGVFKMLRSSLEDPELREHAGRLLPEVQFSAPQLEEAAQWFSRLGIMERPLLLEAFAGKSDGPAGLALVRSMDQAGAIASMPQDALNRIFSGFPENVHQELSAVRARQTPPDLATRLQKLNSQLPPGDPLAGATVFQSAAASCGTCHPIGYKGGNLGPDLSRVGSVRTRQDLLESLIFPSASFVRSYEPVTLTRKDGSLVYGIPTAHTTVGMTLRTAPGQLEVTVPAAEIQLVEPGKYSLMPQGLEQVLSPQQLADLLSYLESCK